MFSSKDLLLPSSSLSQCLFPLWCPPPSPHTRDRLPPTTRTSPTTTWRAPPTLTTSPTVHQEVLLVVVVVVEVATHLTCRFHRGPQLLILQQALHQVGRPSPLVSSDHWKFSGGGGGNNFPGSQSVEEGIGVWWTSVQAKGQRGQAKVSRNSDSFCAGGAASLSQRE